MNPPSKHNFHFLTSIPQSQLTNSLQSAFECRSNLGMPASQARNSNRRDTCRDLSMLVNLSRVADLPTGSLITMASSWAVVSCAPSYSSTRPSFSEIGDTSRLPRWPLVMHYTQQYRNEAALRLASKGRLAHLQQLPVEGGEPLALVRHEVVDLLQSPIGVAPLGRGGRGHAEQDDPEHPSCFLRGR